MPVICICLHLYKSDSLSWQRCKLCPYTSGTGWSITPPFHNSWVDIYQPPESRPFAQFGHWLLQLCIDSKMLCLWIDISVWISLCLYSDIHTHMHCISVYMCVFSGGFKDRKQRKFLWASSGKKCFIFWEGKDTGHLILIGQLWHSLVKYLV